MHTLTHNPLVTVSKRLLIGTLVLIALVTVGVALTHAEGTMDHSQSPLAMPSTTAYRFSSHPMIAGTVVSVNDHQMVVDTDQGEQIMMEVDSRTMAPRDLRPGMVMRAEFLALEDCRFYVQRILPIRGGMSTDRLQAYANTTDDREAIAWNASATSENLRSHDAVQAGSENRESPPQTVSEHSPIMTATPTTADYQFSTRPTLSGRVVTVNDHRLVVVTDQGQAVALVMDSHTMVPREVAPGTIMRADFSRMKDGRYYAQRISPVGHLANREQAYAQTHDSDWVLAQNLSDCGTVSHSTGNTTASVVEQHPSPVVGQIDALPAEVPETLPQTASHQPLMALLGLLALGAAGALALGRRLHTA